MKKSTIKSISTMLCASMLFGFAAEAPLMAASSASVPVTVNGQTVNVTPGKWVTVNNGTGSTSYNIRYVNGSPVALDMKQYTTLAFGESAASTATTASQASQSTTAAQSASTSSSGGILSSIKNFGSKIASSFKSGKDAGQAVGNKTVETVKDAGSTVAEGTKSVGSKIGNLLKSAKEKVTGLFKKKDAAPSSSKTDQVASEQTSQASEQATSGKKQSVIGKAASAVKGMASQGVQNVKNSLKSGFSAKNILMTAGITVGVDLATQVMRGQNPSIKSALKQVVCAEFAGSVVGSVTGAAAGSFFTPFLSAIPVVGGVLSALAPTFGSVVGSSVGAYLAGDIKNGRFSLKNAIANIDWAGVVGQTIGSTAGAALGSFLGPVGTIIGGMVGGYIGNWAAQKLKSIFGNGGKTYGSIGMPVGTVTAVNSQSGIVSVGANNSTGVTVAGVGSTSGVTSVNTEIPVAASAASMGTYSDEVQLAQAKYEELYKLYNQMLSEGRQSDAITVAQEMNKAKAEYQSLLANK